MTTSEQWLKTMPSASWRDLDQLKEWIEAIQGEAFESGLIEAAQQDKNLARHHEPCAVGSYTESAEVHLESIEKFKKPLAKSQEGE